MRRAIALTALALMFGAALTGCRGARDGDAQPGQEPAAVSAPNSGSKDTAPAPGAEPAVAVSQADQDLAELDRLLADLDGQLARADQTPADAD